jgi:hypothetical protein
VRCWWMTPTPGLPGAATKPAATCGRKDTAGG